MRRAVVIGYGQVGQLITGHMYIALRSNLRQMLIALLNRFFGFWRYLAVVIVNLVYEIVAVLFLLLDILIVSFLKRCCGSSDSVRFKLYQFFLALTFSLQPLLFLLKSVRFHFFLMLSVFLLCGNRNLFDGFSYSA